MHTQCNVRIDVELLQKNDDGTYTYTGHVPIQLSSNGVSSNGPKILNGHILYICKNQYTEATSEMRMHAYFDVDTSHAEKCACGVCGSTFEKLPALPNACNCEVKTLRNSMDEPCCIM